MDVGLFNTHFSTHKKRRPPPPPKPKQINEFFQCEICEKKYWSWSNFIKHCFESQHEKPKKKITSQTKKKIRKSITNKR